MKGIICSQIGCFSSRKSAEKELVVVTTIFWPRDLDTVATTGSLTPLSRKALLKAFLKARGEKSADVRADLIRISLFDLAVFLVVG